MEQSLADAVKAFKLNQTSQQDVFLQYKTRKRLLMDSEGAVVEKQGSQVEKKPEPVVAKKDPSVRSSSKQSFS